MILFNETGRTEIVYGKPCKEDQIEHEVLITEAELLLGGPFIRNVSIGKTTADALLIRSGIHFYIEVDNETEGSKQLREKWARYGEFDGYVLVICRTKARLRTVMRSADRIKDRSLFARFKRLRSNKEPWIDQFGKRTSI